MALSPKERERIIEEETLRYETRRNLHHQYCSSRPRRWPWILIGILAVCFLYNHIFCRGGYCGWGHERMGYHCGGMNWAPQQDESKTEPAPQAPEKK
jgi:hypothetical protein